MGLGGVNCVLEHKTTTRIQSHPQPPFTLCNIRAADAKGLLTIFGIRTNVLNDSIVSMEECAQDLQMIVNDCHIGFVVAFVQAVLLSGNRSVVGNIDRLVHVRTVGYILICICLQQYVLLPPWCQVDDIASACLMLPNIIACLNCNNDRNSLQAPRSSELVETME